MRLKPINPNWARKVTGRKKVNNNQPKQVIDLNLIKAEIRNQVMTEVKATLSFELNRLKIELYNMLKNELLISSKDNQINTLNQLNASLMQNREFSTDSLLRELKNELSSINKAKEEVKEEPIEEVEEVKEEVKEEIEEEVKEEPTSAPAKHFEIDGNPVLSYCADYVYKVETSKDKPEKKAEKVFEFLKFDAVKNSNIRVLDIYSVIGMAIPSELKTKLVENNILTEEEIQKYNEPFNLGEDDIVEE